MKKIWKKRKNSEAVSPVIATILMVAITVVLAAVLYVMVMGFGTTGAQTPTGSFVGTPTNTTTGYKMTFGVLSPTTTWNSCKLSLTVLGTVTTLSPAAITLNSGTGTSAIAFGTASGKTWSGTITDLAADGKISQGDSIVINPTIGWGSGSYSLSLIFTSTGGQITAQTWTV